MGLDQRDGVRITERVVQVTVILWIVWDVIAVVLWGGIATESVAIGGWAERIGTIPLVAGILCGHFFWKVPKETTYWKYRYPVLVAIGVISMLTDLIVYRVVQTAYPLGVVAALPPVGYFLGHLLWAQKRKNS